MPGRRSSAVLSVKKAKTQWQKGKRSLNALAIAEEQTPVKPKIRYSRLGQSETEPLKRKRQEGSGDIESEEGRERVKRPKAGEKDRHGNEIEAGSDSSGNDWVVGRVDDDDNSDLDSDEAMGESDEERFEGFAFGGSSGATSSKQGHPIMAESEGKNHELRLIDLRERGEESGNSDAGSDGLGDDAVDLAVMLDGGEDSEDEPRRPKNLEKSGLDDGRDTNSEASADEDTSVVLFSGDEEEPGDSAKLAALQAYVSTMDEQGQDSICTRAPANALDLTSPSEFGVSAKRKLPADDKLLSITDPGLRSSRNMLAHKDGEISSKRGGVPKHLDVPLPRRQQDRLDRAAAYDKSKETLKRWIDTVKHNRRAEHLSFPLKDPYAVVAQGSQRLRPTSGTQPLTELESTIQDILQDSGLAAPTSKSEEDKLQAFEELQTNKMSLEEVQARRAELRKARELLFREEVRAKRIKKIKSKSYRKVHRKEKQRVAQQEKHTLTAAGLDNSEGEQERKDRRRAEERMGARHRESKWAKGVKDSGRAKWDEDARGGVTEMARRGEELRRRIEGKQVARGEDEIVSSESESGDEDKIGDEDHKSLDRLQKLYENGNELDSEARGSKLASMDFMKKAEAVRKARNDTDVENLRREFAGEETPGVDGTTDGPGRRVFGPPKNTSQPTKAPPIVRESEFEERGGSGSEDGDNHGPYHEDDLDIVLDNSAPQQPNTPPTKPFLLDRKNQELPQTKSGQILEGNENPWLMSSKQAPNTGRRRTHDANKDAIISNTVEPGEAPSSESAAKPRSALRGAREAEKAHQEAAPPKIAAPSALIDNSDQEEDDDTENLPFVFRNQDLVRKAFAGDEVVADFEKEKQETIEDEQGKVIDNTLPGWGNWTGAGIDKKQQKRNKGRVLTKEPGIAKEKRRDAKLDRVIINEKRAKKNAKYLASNLPHPFETRQQYERSLRVPVGPEWTTKETFQSATKPRMLMKQGVIAPMTKPII